MADQSEIDKLVAQLDQGDEQTMDRLVSLVYDELRTLAHRRLRGHRPGQTLNTTALVHEAYMQLAGREGRSFKDRNHFLGTAATAMRYIVIDYARSKAAQKRGGGLQRFTLDAGEIPLADRAPELLALDEALGRLSALDERLARLVELRFFGGLTVAETAAVMGTSESTVKRDWRKASLLLRELLRDGEPQ